MSTMNAKLDPLLYPDEATEHIRGSASAPVTVIEYGDFECPLCRQAHEALEVMLPHFSHQVRFIFRRFPLREAHPHAELAAEAADAAGAQGKFWPMHDLPFEQELIWSSRTCSAAPPRWAWTCHVTATR